LNDPAKLKTLKTFNDPVYGFITIEDELIFKIIEHPAFQRLRRISQLGLTNLVYSGANHSRFQHALGAMNLVKNAIAVLRAKGENIDEREEQATKIAVLLHDVGHGPFSHALEHSIVLGTSHEEISLRIMSLLNEEFTGQLDLAISVYKGTHHKKFLHQLVSGQLDVDRLDYLKRDSFFTGVSEGAIGSERLIKMMRIHEGELAIEAKALYSLEKFLLARRLMYWQVYLHKAVLSAEFLLLNILKRARELAMSNVDIWCDSTLSFFIGVNNTPKSNDWIDTFLELDDTSILYHIKVWQQSSDRLLSMLCQRLIQRKLLKVSQISEPFSPETILAAKSKIAEELGLSISESNYLLFQKTLTNTAYETGPDPIKIIYKSGEVKDISETANLFQYSPLQTPEVKHFIYYPEGYNPA